MGGRGIHAGGGVGTHYVGRAAEVRALDTYIKLTRATSSVGVRLSRRLAAAELTPTQLGVLEALLHLGALGQRVLGDKLLMSGGNITTVVDNLERRRLVRRERRGDDRRHVTVHLTPRAAASSRESSPATWRPSSRRSPRSPGRAGAAGPAREEAGPQPTW